MRPLFAMTVLLTAPLFAAGSVQAAPERGGLGFDHHDWTLACDNTRTCRAAGYQDEDGKSEPVSVMLTRQGGPDQPVTAKLKIGDYDNHAPVPSPRLRINGKDLGPIADADGGDLSAPQTAALLKALRQDSTILVTSADKRQWQVSDRGASAVLLKMDEFQGRLGTPGALVKPGKRNEASVPAALPMPVIRRVGWPATRPEDTALAASASLRAALLAAQPADDCNVLAGLPPYDDDEPTAISVQRLDDHKLLASAVCWRGAYNEGVGYWVINAKAPYAPVLVTTGASDAADGEISMAQKGRGLGDCWVVKAWVWDGRRFQQSLDQTTGMCRLVTAGGAWEMPTLVSEVK